MNIILFSVKVIEQVVYLHFQRSVANLFFKPQRRMCMLGYSNMVLNGDLFQDVSLQGDRSLRWPLWLRAAIPGTISLYFTIYYEMENVSSMKYRTLRMHYNLQVMNFLAAFVFLLRI